MTTKWEWMAMAAGLGLALAACAPETRPGGDGDDDPNGPDASLACSGTETRCLGNTFQTCLDGMFVDSQVCSGTQTCNQFSGCEDCDPASGGCNVDIGNCQTAAQNKSYIGCEYWPVDLDNAVEILGGAIGGLCTDPGAKAIMVPTCGGLLGLGPYSLCDYGNTCPDGSACTPRQVCALNAQNSPFAVVVSNPGAQTAMVTLKAASGQTMTASVAPGAVASLFPQNMGLPDQSLDYSGIQRKAYRLTSDQPIVAYQFNPLDNVGVFSNDASLLIPATAYDTKYFALIWPTLVRRPNAADYSAYISVVASAPGQTQVTVNATAAVRAGAMVPAFGPGTQTFTLNQFDVLNLEGGPTGDLSGSSIECQPACGVFVGTEASGIGVDQGGNCCADHLEDQVFPASTWGKQFALARTKQRKGEPDLVRVLAQKPGTTVTFNPPAQGNCPTLDAGKFCEVRILGDTEIKANEPILVGHYLMSIGTANDTGNPAGDPAISFGVPTEQFRKDYTFLVPAQYMENHVSLVAPADGTVMLDGQDVTGQLAAFGSNAFKGGRIQVQPGQHKLVCDKGCGLEVYGYDGAVSYLFAGGLDLEQIVVE
jgi:hypothetical protein